jgi:isoleucyl-tRNA synthetase
LVQEGLAREFVRRVQDQRKQVGLDISDHIRVVYSASEGLSAALETFRDYIMGETLADEMAAGAVPEDESAKSDKFDGEEVAFSIEKIG